MAMQNETVQLFFGNASPLHHLKKFGRTIFKNQDDSFEFLSPQPTDEELTAIYSKSYYDTWGIETIRLDPRPASLAGRERVLAELATRLTAEEGTMPRVAVLHGMGGVGKTSVALEYAHLHLDDYGLIWQFSAEDPVALSANFAEMATLLGVRDLLDGANPVQQVHAALAVRPGRWLLLMDNIIDPGALRTVMPPAGNGHVLVTSQNPHWPAEQAVAVPA